MQPIIYDVAVSIDGFIAGPDSDISAFPHEGRIVEDYFERLQSYSCAIMGKATYEFGYSFGLTPGENPYPHMKSVVFSSSIDLPAGAEVEVVREGAPDRIDRIRRESEGPVYLCGGGKFAGWLLSLGKIDKLRLKRAPIVLGAGAPLFGDCGRGVKTREVASTLYENGALFQEFDLIP